MVIPLEVGSHTHPTSTSGIFVPRRDLPYRKRRMTSSSESEKEEARDLSSGDPVQESAETSATDRVNYTSSGESSDDDMEIQAWRGNRFLREEFIRSQVCLSWPMPHFVHNILLCSKSSESRPILLQCLAWGGLKLDRQTSIRLYVIFTFVTSTANW